MKMYLKAILGFVLNSIQLNMSEMHARALSLPILFPVLRFRVFLLLLLLISL